MGKAVGAKGLQFKWGKKRGTGGKEKDIQFYESFTYDGDEYCLYDCVLLGDQNEPDTGEPFIGKIIKIWENTSKPAKFAKKVRLLWFLKPSEIEPFLEGVPDILANELFLASGEGPGLANTNRVETLGGKCSVLCISKDKRNPQPSQEEIKSADFVFRRAFDVGSQKVVDTIEDTIAGVDVKFIFNRVGCGAEAVQKVEAEINGNVNSLKPNGPSASGLVREIEDNSIESSDRREKSYGCTERKGKGHNQLATKRPTLTEERCNKDSCVQEGSAHNEHDPCEASDSRENHCDGKARESEVKKHCTDKKSVPAESRDSITCEASGSRVNHSDAKKAQANDRRIEDNSIKSSDYRESSYDGCKEVKEKGRSQLAIKKTTLAEERSNKDSGVEVGRASDEPDPCEASGSRENHCGKAKESEVKKKFTKQKSLPVEERYGISCEASGSRVNQSDVKKAQANKITSQLTKQKSMPAEERDSVSCEASASRVHPDVKKAQAYGETEDSAIESSDCRESEVRKKFSKQKSMPAEERDGINREACGSRVNHSDVKTAQANDIKKRSDVKTAQANDIKKRLTKQKSMPAEARNGRDFNGFDNMPQKKQKLDGSVTLPDGQNTNMLQNIRSNGKKETNLFKIPRDKVTGDGVPPGNPSFVKKKRDLRVSVSEGKDAKTTTETGLSKRSSCDGKLLKRSEEKMLADDKERSYQVTEVSRKPDAVKNTWYGILPWEESMREAEEKGKLVLLQNLDPTYTSGEVEDIVYSALNEQCTARMIECTSATIPHIGQALVIFNSREAAEGAIRRLDEGCLLLSNGRPLVAAFAKVNPPGKPSSFAGHIKLNKLQMRREMREAVATSHCSQENNIEKDMAMEWCLHQARSHHTFEQIFKRQSEEARSLRINFRPKLP